MDPKFVVTGPIPISRTGAIAVSIYTVHEYLDCTNQIVGKIVGVVDF